jgi:uncharacterized membrane protein
LVQVVSYFNGFETGDGSELNSLGAGNSVVTSPVRSGAYSLHSPVSGTGTIFVAGLGAIQNAGCAYFYFTTLPSGSPNVIIEAPVSGTARFTIGYFTTTGTLDVFDNGATLGLTSTAGLTVLQTNTWYRIEWVLDLAAGGAVKLWLNGHLEIGITHTSDVSVSPTDQYRTGNLTPGNSSLWYFDDFRVDTGGLNPIGNHVVQRFQGAAGTPSFDAWAKNGAATSALCWSDTPFNAGTNCSDTSLSAYQTMKIRSPTNFVLPEDVVNACKVGLVGNSNLTAAGAGAFFVSYYDGSVKTDTANTFTTVDAYYQSSIFTDTLANLINYEIGAGHGVTAATHTVEDVWLMVDFTPSAGETSIGRSPVWEFSPNAGPTKHLRPTRAYPRLPYIFTLAASSGAYALSGVTISNTIARIVSAITGVYTLTGVAAALVWNHVLTAVKGAYVLTGISSGLSAVRKLTAVTGAYVLTGVAATLMHGYVLAAVKGAYTLTGVAITNKITRIVTAVTGAYVLTGVAAKLMHGYVLAAVKGAYTLTGRTAALSAIRTMAMATGVYILTGNATILAVLHQVSLFLKRRFVAPTLQLIRDVTPSLTLRRSVSPKLTKLRDRDPSLGD